MRLWPDLADHAAPLASVKVNRYRLTRWVNPDQDVAIATDSIIDLLAFQTDPCPGLELEELSGVSGGSGLTAAFDLDRTTRLLMICPGVRSHVSVDIIAGESGHQAS